MRIAYLVSRFPKITETFVLNEMLALEDLGARIELYPLIRQQETLFHPSAARFVEQAHYTRILSSVVVGSQIFWLLHAPRKYLSLWLQVLLKNWNAPATLVRSSAAVLLGAYFARRQAKDRVDHIHAHFATYAALAALTMHRLTGVPFSFTAHAHDIFVKRSLLSEKIAEAAFVVTISEHNRAYLEELYGDLAIEKVQVVRCGVDQRFYQTPEPRRENGELSIVCVAALEEKKGHRYLLEACRLLLDRGIAFRCTLIGDGPLRNQISAQIADLHLDARITLLGQQTHQQVQEHLSQADLMVLPSVRLPSGKQEGIPVALMEGMAMGLPVIATDLSGIPELIEDGQSGILVAERDPEAILVAILRLVHDPTQRDRLGKAARVRVAEAYDLKKNTAQLYRLMKGSTQNILVDESSQIDRRDAIEGAR